MKKILRKLIQGLPVPVKTALARVRDARCGVWILKGRESSGGGEIVAAYAGSETAKNYLAGQFFDGPVQEEPLGRLRRDQALERALSRAKDAALFIWAIPPSQEAEFRPDAFAYLPGWVRMEAVLDEASGFERGDKFRKVRNRAAREGVVRTVTTDPAEFAEFYRGFYLPYIAARHEGAASPLPLDAARRKFIDDGRELIWVKKDGRTLGGCVIGHENGAALFWLIGLAADVTAETAAHLGNAVYYHMFMRAKEKGFLRINMGYCRPFLTDGILEYKRQFGAHVAGARMPDGGLFAIRLLKETTELKALLKNNPFITVAPDGRYGVCAFTDEAADKAAEQIHNRYCAKGGLDLRVYSVEPGIKLEREIRAPLPEEK